MIPTKTGAAAAVGLVLPELNGKLDGYAIRVPTINVSIVDLSFVAARDTTVDEVNAIMKAAADGELKGVLDYTEEPLVSHRLQPQPGVVDVRRDADEGVGPPRQGLELVRQRVGLQQSHARRDHRPDEREVTTDDRRRSPTRPRMHATCTGATTPLIAALLATLVAGCSFAPLTRISDGGSGDHVVTVRSGYFPRRSTELEVDADKAALAYCKTQNRALAVDDRRSVDPDPPAYSTTTVRFRCVPI